MEYRGCGSGESKSCGSAEDEDDINPEFCVEGCYCPKGKSLSQGVCVPDASCPCLYNGKEFNSGSEIKQECNLWFVKFIFNLSLSFKFYFFIETIFHNMIKA